MRVFRLARYTCVEYFAIANSTNRRLNCRLIHKKYYYVVSQYTIVDK